MEAAELARRMGDFYLVASEVLRDVNDITEQQIKHWIVSPFLVTLGWDPHDKKQVFLDYAVKPGDAHADYALLDGEGKPRLIIEVRKPPTAVTESGIGTENAQAVAAPLALITNGHEFSLWYVSGSEPPTPLFVLPLKELAENAESLLGLSAEYRLSDTGLHQLRKSAIRQAVIQMLEENAEKTFDALISWVQSQVAPGALDDTTDEAIRDATMLWLSEEHLSLPGFQPSEGRVTSLRITTAKDWEPFPRGPAGTFQYRFDTKKTLDIRGSAKDVRDGLKRQGLKTATATSF
ncbi:MAG TPA: hypothetical protein VJS68_03095, partial [Thermoplasmata archaeon]|nr:hypothetical protein [Thermoplasmata archaeon]